MPSSGLHRPGGIHATAVEPSLSSSALDGYDPAVIVQAAARLAAGELVAFPTETVYGLGARADDDLAVAKIFEAKGRPSNHPLIVHVCDVAAAAPFTSSLPAVARRLMDAFWPGPLTVIVPRSDWLGAAAAGGQDSIGLRCPSHPVALALLRACQQRGVAGVAAPSANRFGRVSPTRASHVIDEFGQQLMVLDGGDSEVGIESAIVDCTRGRPVLLRPGGLSPAAIAAAAGEPLLEADAAAPRASGTLESHYAPEARVVLLSSGDLSERLAGLLAAQSPDNSMPLGDHGTTLAVYSRTVAKPPGAGVQAWLLWRSMPDDANAVAHELFAVLRGFDDEAVGQIWVEELPCGVEWDGVRDRLRRAAA